ncbi:MAG: type II toxin-antitoxin system PemK/MazF family toxin [Dehalococcoidia bacterium]
MKRGEIWTVSGGSRYTGKPRPAVIVQEDRFSGTDSVTLCVFTTDPTEAPLLRLEVEPSDVNGLQSACRLMIDKVTTVPKTRLGRKVGRLDDDDLLRLNRALLVFLGLAAPVPRGARRSD